MKQAADNRRGVALIIVLGFLSIMVLMAVAFLTQARMERMVADATLEAMRGRQIMRTALNAAMNDYSGTLWDENLVMPTKNFEVFASAPPPGGSVSMGGRTIGDDDIELLVGEVEDWIPWKYRTPAVTNQVADAKWILVRENPSSASSRILGRYAYVCFDMSGGIDANLAARADEVGGHDARVASNRVRRTVRQVPIRTLPEVLDAGKFQSYRSGWKGFDSLYSLIKLTDGKKNDGSSTASSARWQPERKEDYGPATSNVTDLVPYSMSAFRGGRYNRASGLWAPSPILVKNVVDWRPILNPLSSQFFGSWGDWINKAINDYTNNLAWPMGVDYPSPKNIPMLNEMVATYGLNEIPNADGITSQYELVMNLTFEYWYPFPSKDNEGGTYRMAAPTVGGSFAVTGDAQLWFRIAMQGGSGAAMVQLREGVAPSPASIEVEARYNNGRPYTPTTPSSNFTYRIPIERMAGDTNALDSGMTLRIQGLNVVKPVYLLVGAGTPADMLPNGLSFPGANLLNSQTRTVARAVTDPRLNHETGQWADEGDGSLGEMNDWIQNAAAEKRFRAEGTNLYCRNGPMETPAELGFISAGREWGTIDLCTDSAVEMMAGLVTDTNLWGAAIGRLDRPWASTNVFYTNGTINPNTRSSNVLMTAFIDLATHEVPNVDSDRITATPLDEDTIGGMDVVALIAKQILEETQDGTFITSFQAGTDWARIPCMRQGGALSLMDLNNSGFGFNNNQREALIRNTWGLFSPENSLFTVVVIAQAIKEGPANLGIWNATDDIVTGERRAVALVWRDPFKTGRNLHHEMFVRVFRYLND